MAEPGRLVRVRPDGRVTVARARQGGRENALRAVLAGRSPRAVAGWGPARTVEPVAWLDRLDYLRVTAVYVDGRRPRAYLPLWFGLPTAGLVAAPTAGLAVRVHAPTEVRALRRAWRERKAAVADAVVAGRLPVVAAPVVLAAALAGRATLDAGKL